MLCEGGAPTERVRILRARTDDGRDVSAGGDVFSAVLSRGLDEYYPLTLIDNCDGTYDAILPCGALWAVVAAGGGTEYRVSALLEHAHVRSAPGAAVVAHDGPGSTVGGAAVPAANTTVANATTTRAGAAAAAPVYYCGSAVHSEWTAWDGLTYAQLSALYVCVGEPVGGGTAITVRIAPRRTAIATVASEQTTVATDEEQPPTPPRACWPPEWTWEGRGERGAAAVVPMPCANLSRASSPCGLATRSTTALEPGQARATVTARASRTRLWCRAAWRASG
jgi:hypothetical protein